MHRCLPRAQRPEALFDCFERKEFSRSKKRGRGKRRIRRRRRKGRKARIARLGRATTFSYHRSFRYRVPSRTLVPIRRPRILFHAPTFSNSSCEKNTFELPRESRIEFILVRREEIFSFFSFPIDRKYRLVSLQLISRFSNAERIDIYTTVAKQF